MLWIIIAPGIFISKTGSPEGRIASQKALPLRGVEAGQERNA
jgi:hypothetical protein